MRRRAKPRHTERVELGRSIGEAIELDRQLCVIDRQAKEWPLGILTEDVDKRCGHEPSHEVRVGIVSVGALQVDPPDGRAVLLGTIQLPAMQPIAAPEVSHRRDLRNRSCANGHRDTDLRGPGVASVGGLNERPDNRQ